MSDSVQTMDLVTQPKCVHVLPITIREQGNGLIIISDQLKCKLCGEEFVAPWRDGYSPRLSIPILPAALANGKVSKPAKKPEAPAKPKQTLREQIGDGPGTELAEELERLGVASCQACKAQAIVMNQNGAAWCVENVDALVADILPRARAWADAAPLQDKLAVWWNAEMGLLDKLKSGAKAATWQLDDSLRLAIRSRVLAAVERWEATHNERRPVLPA